MKLVELFEETKVNNKYSKKPKRLVKKTKHELMPPSSKEREADIVNTLWNAANADAV